MSAHNESNLYLDSDASLENRVENLLTRMTVEEKIGQLMVAPYTGDGDSIRTAIRTDIDEFYLGQASPFGREDAPDDPAELVELANEVQRYAVEETRLGIPLLLISNAVHGNGYVDGAAVFPHSIGMAATRDTDLVERVATVTARELAALGGHQNYDPVCDIVRDPRWGRTFETFGESPTLCSAFSAAKVRGYQGADPAADDRVLATAKHFPAYGKPVQGEDCAPVELSEYELNTTFLPAFEAALEAGAEAVMPCYNAIDGEPVHGSRRFLTQLLRERLGFDGFLVSDHHGIEMLHEEHYTSRSMSESMWQSTRAGMDAWLGPDVGESYATALRRLVDDGEISVDRIDRSVRRILSVKFRLGLFEDPYIDPDEASSVVGRDEHRALALECARKSQTLLKNDGILPLSKDLETVLVAGPNADTLDNQFGGWSARDNTVGTTLLEGVEERVADDTEVVYEQGAGIREERDLDAAVEEAVRADVAIVVLGENQYIHDHGPSKLTGPTGEFPTRSQLELPAAQQRLIERIHGTGTPTVAVFICGRPLTIEAIANDVPALLWSYYPGTDGGQAIAEVLFGEVNPSGKLPISIPRSVGHLPTHFNHLDHPNAIHGGNNRCPDPYDPLFPFGHGLSYTEFTYEDLTLHAETYGPGETVEATVTVRNEGDVAGEEAVDCFVRDEYSSRVTPVRELGDFGRVTLESGESTTVSFSLEPSDLAVYHGDGEWVVEPGQFALSVGDETASFEVERRFELRKEGLEGSR